MHGYKCVLSAYSIFERPKTAQPLRECQWCLPLPTTSAAPRWQTAPTSPGGWLAEALSMLASRGPHGTSILQPTMVPQLPPPSPMGTARLEDLGPRVSSASSPPNLCAGEMMGWGGWSVEPSCGSRATINVCMTDTNSRIFYLLMLMGKAGESIYCCKLQ